jgi:hypothetical protein
MGFSKFTFILKTIECDDETDLELLDKVLKSYLKAIKLKKRRIVVYVATEPCKTLDIPKENTSE